MNQIGLNEQQSKELAQKLNTLLANYHIFYINVRGYHWNIKGEKFFELHLKFEELYNDIVLIIISGAMLIVLGVLIWLFGEKLKFFGKLPGDIRIEKENVKIYIPITTMLLVSLMLSFILWLIQKMK